ncbi:bis(5'-nucleosyl)-tetraphosphatase [asymmetrical], putative, partial [Plasmodium ovale curtisi]
TKTTTTDNSKIEFLFLKASYGNKHWTPPKGLHEDDEEGITTAKRETLEETGINEDKYKLLDFEKTLKYNVHNGMKETTYYLAVLLNNDETMDTKFVNKSGEIFGQEFRKRINSSFALYNQVGHLQPVGQDDMYDGSLTR